MSEFGDFNKGRVLRPGALLPEVLREVEKVPGPKVVSFSGISPDVGMLILCYVSQGMAYFTSAALEEQWGDDWNDVPYEHNAGRPYSHVDRAAVGGGTRVPVRIEEIVFSGPFEEPCGSHVNSPYSVHDINRGAVPWVMTVRLASPEGSTSLYAGTPLSVFVAEIQRCGGKVYLPMSWAESERK